MADEERGGVRRWLVRIGSIVAMLPVLYVLSIGPVAGWAQRRQQNDAGSSVENLQAIKSFYTPLIIIHDNCPPIGDALEWYVDLWERPYRN
jgi:hypothetical protein